MAGCRSWFQRPTTNGEKSPELREHDSSYIITRQTASEKTREKMISFSVLTVDLARGAMNREQANMMTFDVVWSSSVYLQKGGTPRVLNWTTLNLNVRRVLNRRSTPRTARSQTQRAIT